MSFTFTIETTNNKDVVYLSGSLDETSQLNVNYLKNQLGESCTFNLKEITSANSIGISRLMACMREVSQEKELVLEECPNYLFKILGTLDSFNNISILSMYAEFFCEYCNDEMQMLIQRSEQDKKVFCQHCGTEMKSDIESSDEED